MGTVYLDNASTTPLDSGVFEAMVPFLRDHYGNASSVHAIGRKARYAVEDARERTAAVIGAEPAEIIFTSGGTEADNLAIRALSASGNLAISKAEHKAVLTPAPTENTHWLDVDPFARVLIDGIDELPAGTHASVMLVNNETGAINDIRMIADQIHAGGGLLHTDAVQAMGLIDVDVASTGVDMMSLSAHKIGGPKGMGMLYVRGGSPFVELVSGGSQERGRRGGTENVAGIVGFAHAMEKAERDRIGWFDRCTELRSRLVSGVSEAIDAQYVVNSPEGAAPHIFNIAFRPVGGTAIDGEMLILNMDVAGVCISTGSACTSGAIEPSHVLLAAGLEPATAGASVRISIGKQNTADDIDAAIAALQKCISRMVANSDGRIAK